jgi:amino acid transporter
MVLLMINGVVGAGIFGLPATAFKQIGIWSLLAFFVCAIAVYVIILCFAEVSSRFEKTGGPYVYALEAFGPLPAFLTGWLLLLSRFLTYAALINLLVTYLGVFSSWFTGAQGRTITIVSLTLFFGLINHIGIRNTTRVNNFLAIGKMSALLIFIVAGMFFIKPSYFPSTPLPQFSDFSTTVLLLMFSFGGFESVLVNTGEVQNPSKSLPFALMHGFQTAWSLGPFLLLVFVSLVLCWVRLSTRSLAASTIVHASYNFMLFSFMLLGTGGFKHLDKM